MQRTPVLSRVVMGMWAMTVGAAGCAYGITETDEDVQDQAGPICACDCETTSTGVPGTTSTPTGTGGSGGADAGTSTGGQGGEDAGSGGSSVCDQRGDCTECANCSLSYDCMAEANACMNSLECNDLLDCLYACVDDACMNACASQYPTGMNLYLDMSQCAFCDACPIDCQYEAQGMCY